MTFELEAFIATFLILLTASFEIRPSNNAIDSNHRKFNRKPMSF